MLPNKSMCTTDSYSHSPLVTACDLLPLLSQSYFNSLKKANQLCSVKQNCTISECQLSSLGNATIELRLYSCFQPPAIEIFISDTAGHLSIRTRKISTSKSVQGMVNGRSLELDVTVVQRTDNALVGVEVGDSSLSVVSSPDPTLSRGKGVWWQLNVFLVVLSQHSCFREGQSDCRYCVCILATFVHAPHMHYVIPSARRSRNGVYNQESIQMSPDPPPRIGVWIWERDYFVSYNIILLVWLHAVSSILFQVMANHSGRVFPYHEIPVSCTKHTGMLNCMQWNPTWSVMTTVTEIIC